VARKMLGRPRASSVFTPPIRPALKFDNREEASELNHSLSGRKIGVQSWAIAPKIREVDEFLRLNPDARKKFREVHPEVLFWAFNGQKAIPHNKKKSAGYEERIACLRNHFSLSSSYSDASRNAFL
jgi:predicted RNase H-like nuclease